MCANRLAVYLCKQLHRALVLNRLTVHMCKLCTSANRLAVHLYKQIRCTVQTGLLGSCKQNHCAHGQRNLLCTRARRLTALVQTGFLGTSLNRFAVRLCKQIHCALCRLLCICAKRSLHLCKDMLCPCAMRLAVHLCRLAVYVCKLLLPSTSQLPSHQNVGIK